MQAAAVGCLAAHGTELFLAPVLHRNRNRVEVFLYRAVDFGKNRAELGEHGSILGARRLGESVARRREQLDAFLDRARRNLPRTGGLGERNGYTSCDGSAISCERASSRRFPGNK